MCSGWFGATYERIVAVKTIAGFRNSDETTHSFFDRYFLGRFIPFLQCSPRRLYNHFFLNTDLHVLFPSPIGS